MARAVAKALALVNWRGVFYERYWLDSNVTALEGPNGAGKTTVMVAAYLVLLPDLHRLRFTNVGESGASAGDKGIWGRLGDPARPSYAALSVQLPQGERVVIGVHIERKREPVLTLTPFLVTGAQVSSSLADILLKREGATEEVPTLAEFKALVAAADLRLKIFRSSKEYFAELFELGISALRLNTEEERGKFNDMLRTSMTGGISRALTSELRGFMLKEDTGMGDTLSRMRENLRSCHRTRIEVAEARALEQEITGVYEAGHTMFIAGTLAAKRTAHDVEVQVGALREALSECETRRQGLAAQRERLLELAESYRERFDEVSRERLAATALLESARSAQLLRRQIVALSAERTDAARREQESTEAFSRADSVRETARSQVLAARQEAAGAARGLADLQVGLDELHRKAHAFRHAKGQLQQLREALERPELPAGELEGVVAELQRAIAELDGELARRDREQARATRARGEYDAAWQALCTLTDESAHDEPHAAAQEALAACRIAAQVERQVSALETDLAAARERSALRNELVTALSADIPAASLTSASALQSALSRAEEQLQTHQNELLTTERELRAAEAKRATGARRIEHLEERAARWARISELRLALRECGVAAEEPAQLAEWLRETEGRERKLDRELRQLAQEREDCLQRAAAMQAPIGAFEAELLRARDEVGGELLSERYQGVGPELAGALQARLGPLARAIVVEDPQAAAARLHGKPRDLDEIWFVQAGAQLLSVVLDEATQPRVKEDDLLVVEGQMARLTRVSPRPTLGRQAREQEAERLLELGERLTQQLDERERERKELEQARRRAVLLLDSRRAWEDGDPGPALQQERDAFAADHEGLRGQVEAARQRFEVSRQRVGRLAAAQRRAHLLDATGGGAQLDRIAADLEKARQAAAWLEPRRQAYAQLERTIDALISRPATDEELGVWEREAAGLAAKRDGLYALCELAMDLRGNQAALSWERAVAALDEHKDLVPALVEQHEQAEARLLSLESRLAEAEVARDGRSEERDRARTRLASLVGQEEELKRQLAALALEDEPARAETLASERLAATQALVEALEQEGRERLAAEAVITERERQVDRELDTLGGQLKEAEARSKPAKARWRGLRDEHAALVEGAVACRAAEPLLELAAEPLSSLCQSKAELLLDRLAMAPSGADLAADLQARFDPAAAALEGAFASLWMRARDWLLKRLPVQFADAAEPLDALERLSGDLSQLERRLQRQEDLLRGTSADVGRSIDVQLRRATAQVRRINEYLEGISFGGIAAIRVRVGRDQTMESVLLALRDGSAQELLFQSTLPIEDALDEIFRRYGGGRKGGARVLDYREYLELEVLVQRRGATDWEPANPSRVSTGEAIGVGAALMMVILREWERDSTLMRDEPSLGAMRFLFLDEANRLSPDNLRVLFELCQALELQLLIAAPEVAHAKGNTTYRLVRRDGLDGTEEVIVSGRRSAVPDADSAPAADGLPPEPEQLSLGETGA